MSKDRVIKPGKWWIVRFRQMKSYERITGYLTCKNAFHAGHSGFDRKWRMVRSKKGRGGKVRRFKTRQWDLRGYGERRLAYRFAELKDLRSTIRSELIRSWMADHNGILEILEVEGCLYYHTVTSERVIERRFSTTNEMEILAIECALGEV